MKWNPFKLDEHYQLHPKQEKCWEEFMGHSISKDEYEESSIRTATRRCKIQFLATKVSYDVVVRQKIEDARTRHFVDGKIFTTIMDEESERIKTHFHIHEGGKNKPHESGSTRKDFYLLLDVFLDELHNKVRNQQLSNLYFQYFTESVPLVIQQALKKL